MVVCLVNVCDLPTPVKNQMCEILNKLETGQQFDAVDIYYVNATTVPVQNILESVRHSPGMVENTINLLSSLVATFMIEELITGYAKEAIVNANNQSQVNFDKFISSVDQVKKDLHAQLDIEVKQFEEIFRSFKLALFFNDQLNERVSLNLSKAINSAGNGN